MDFEPGLIARLFFRPRSHCIGGSQNSSGIRELLYSTRLAPPAVGILQVVKKSDRFIMKKIWSLSLLTGVLLLAPSVNQGGKLFDGASKKQLTVYLQDICRWAVDAKLSAWPGFKSGSGGMERLAVQGGLGRALMAAGELTKDGSKYVEEALRWGNTLVGQQRRAQTSQGGEGGYWADASGNIELSENCMAAAALGRACATAEGSRKKEYLQAMERLAHFLLEGTTAEPALKRPAVGAWGATGGEQKGAWGSGIIKETTSLLPSTRSSAAAAFFFAELYGVTRNKQYRDVAMNTVAWLLKSRHANGEFPEVVDGKEAEEISYIGITYCTEAILSAFYLLDDSAFNKQLPIDMENTVRQLMRVQGENGVWGEGSDKLGSPGVAMLLCWYYSNPPSKPDESIPQSVDKFWQLLSNPVHAQSFGIFVNGLATACLGVATAEMIKPGITYKKL